MIQKIPAAKRYKADHGWLSSFHLFSFAEYYDPENTNFGVLRVFNDDRIDAESGFGAHGHRNMEIITLMLEGELTHQDNMGNSATMKSGEVQYMSAGTGVIHSEMNNSKERTHLYQIWIVSKEREMEPMYDQKDFSQMESNVLVPVASGKDKEGAIPIRADATIYKAELRKDQTVDFAPESGRGVFLYVTKGALEVNGDPFKEGDQARITNENRLSITAASDSQFVLIDVIL